MEENVEEVVVQDEAEQFEEAQQKKPKVELTEEEAKTAAENVTRLLGVLKRYQSLEARRKEKLSNLRKEYESLPDDSYKQKQVWSKIKVLERIAEPKWVNTKKDE